jgi:hypothetical protein
VRFKSHAQARGYLPVASAANSSTTKKAPGDAGALIAEDIRRKSVFRDEGRRTPVEQVVGTHFEDLLGRMIGKGTEGDAGINTTRAESLGHGLRTVVQIIVFHFDGPIPGQRMLNANTEEKTIQSATLCE